MITGKVRLETELRKRARGKTSKMPDAVLFDWALRAIQRLTPDEGDDSLTFLEHLYRLPDTRREA